MRSFFPDFIRATTDGRGYLVDPAELIAARALPDCAGAYSGYGPRFLRVDMAKPFPPLAARPWPGERPKHRPEVGPPTGA